MKNVTPEQLAKEFSTVLKSWLSAEEMKSVIEKNETPEYNGCCASHDYCDANMAIDEAFIKLMERDFVFYDDEKPETEKQNEEDTALENNAWAIAKTNKFYIS